MSSSGLDAYAVVIARGPSPPEEPDRRQAAREVQQAMFGQEHDAAWTADLTPARPGRQRHPAPPEACAAPGDTAGAERGAMCILDSHGTHAARGLHCPHHLPDPGDADEITTVSFRA